MRATCPSLLAIEKLAAEISVFEKHAEKWRHKAAG